MNSKSIRIKEKKKLRSVSKEFNKKLGQYELQVKEGGAIIQREELKSYHKRFLKEYEDDPLLADFKTTDED